VRGQPGRLGDRQNNSVDRGRRAQIGRVAHRTGRHQGETRAVGDRRWGNVRRKARNYRRKWTAGGRRRLRERDGHRGPV